MKQYIITMVIMLGVACSAYGLPGSYQQLIKTIESGDVRSVEQALSKKPDLTIRNEDDNDKDILNKTFDILIDKTYRQNEVEKQTTLTVYRKIIELLLKAGADVNAGSHVHQTGVLAPLHRASLLGDIALLQLLIDYKADVNLQVKDRYYPTEKSYSPLHYIARSMCEAIVYASFLEQDERDKIFKPLFNVAHQAADFLIKNGAKKDSKMFAIDNTTLLAPRKFFVECIQNIPEDSQKMFFVEIERFKSLLQ